MDWPEFRWVVGWGCPMCKGTGKIDGWAGRRGATCAWDPCPHCGGTGVIPVGKSADGPVITNGTNTGEPLHRFWDPIAGKFVLVWSDDPAELISACMEIVGPMPARPAGVKGGDILQSATRDAQGNAIATYSFDPLPAAELNAQEQEYSTDAGMWTARMNAMVQFATQMIGLKAAGTVPVASKD